MEEKAPVKQKPICSFVSIGCLLIGLILARSVAIKINQGETLTEYGSLGISTSFLVALLLTGFVAGLVGLIRGEKPFVFPLLVLLFNSILFFAVILNLPR
ncbi:MAG: hypothetical protein HOH14_07695 [Gammaproteobacteria bacterium]|jgi:hypothetical protein|nr:hypothetical protein [Gammaproteobacteria bacterium]MBT6043362.1 hypothetical protein [Gammaproteobacteria bacterium]